LAGVKRAAIVALVTVPLLVLLPLRYLPIENPKLLWPAGLATVLLVTYGFADVERLALQTATRTAGLGAALGAIVLLVKIMDRANRRERLPVNFDERPALATQRLGLFERVANHE
jgi:hypothetical protein